VWELCPAKFNGTALVVLLKLAASSSREARSFLLVDDLAEACGVEVRALQYCLRKLQQAGVLHVRKRKAESNCYTLDRDAIRKLPRVKTVKPVDSAPSADDLESVGAEDCTI
jgi:hypothetical protein